MPVEPERFLQLQEHFDAALELPAEQRRAWCLEQFPDAPELRRELLRLVERNERIEHARTRRPLEVAEQAVEQRSDDLRMPQNQIGRYTLHEEIGRGGMGRVFRAIRDEHGLQHEVAIKIVRREVLSEPVLKRFMVERQLLSALKHPGIARLLDAGEAADGTPFVAMELVRGEPLLAYCAARALGVTQRLTLFRQVLAAVAHAHRNLIVHRDIKPGNVMVDDHGQIKLLDFGIAKPLSGGGGETATADRYLTPAYAAPEQFSGGAVSVACDVYSLGALLYELLSGRPPFALDGLSSGEAERLILEVPPATLDRAGESDPSQTGRKLGIADTRAWRHQLRGDLDSMVQRALRKEPALRYLSVEQFDLDVANYLEGQPLLAAGSSGWYRMRKFVRRHRLVVGIGGAALAGLLIAFGLTLRQGAIAAAERDRAQAALGILREAFKAADPTQLAGAELSARQILEAARQRIGPLADTQPLLFGELTAEIVDVQLSLGIAKPEDTSIDRALAIAEATSSSDDLRSRLRMINARRLIAAHSLEAADAALSDLEATRPNDPEVLSARAHYWLIQKEPMRAIPLAQRAFDQLAPGDDSAARTEAAWQLAEAQKSAKQAAAALATLEALLARQIAAFGQDHPRALLTRLRRVDVLVSLKRHPEAVAEAAALAAALPALFGADTSIAALAHATHAAALVAAEDYVGSVPAYEAAGDAYERSLGPRHSNTIKTRFNAAQMLAYVGVDAERVDRQYQAAIDGAVVARGTRDPLVIFFRICYAEVLNKRGDHAAAARALLPPGAEPDLDTLSPDNRDAFRAQLQLALGPIGCSTSAPGQARPSDLAERAQRLYCAAPPPSVPHS